ncbi:MAG TPA: hypothetical protein VEW08_07465 [Steroidobacteraceae bacterium]|nr:hypothetical protein [Steroidobacteraceae bacterium]
MIRISLFAAVLAATATLCACKPNTETPEAAEPPAEEAQGTEAAAPTLALLDACKIRMTLPEAHEWETKWNPAHIQTAGQNPSNVRSAHWGDEAEKKTAREMGTAIPLDLVCGNDDDVKPSIKFDITAFDSSPEEVPLQPGIYKIAPKASPAKNKPGEFIVGFMGFGDSMFQATSGTLKLDRFDMNGASGSFVIDGNEILMGSRPMHIEGTFDMPCRKEMLQSACQSGKAEELN